MARSESDSESESSSSSSEDSEERRRREKKERKRKREKEERKREKKERKKEKKRKSEKEGKRDKKKRKREKEALRATASGATWGKYGIIKETDMYEKQEEFLAWLAEVKGVNQEACGQRELKEHFSSFVEDFNTATLPHEKYYSMAKWYASDQARKARENAKAAAAMVERTDFDDEAARQRELKREREKKNAEITQVMAKAMAQAGADSSLVSDMRDQEAAKLQLRAQYAVGDIEKARAQAEKLDPKYVSPEELRATFGGGGGGGAVRKHKPQKQ